jgi:hypothetical protein
VEIGLRLSDEIVRRRELGRELEGSAWKSLRKYQYGVLKSRQKYELKGRFKVKTKV